MMSTGETYCDLTNNTLCPACPLLALTESDWNNLAEPGVTPFQVADVLASALAAAGIRQANLAAQIAGLLEHVSDTEARIPFNEIIAWDTRANTGKLDRFRGTLDIDSASEFVQKSFAACLERNFFEDCAPDQDSGADTAPSGLESLVTREFGAQTLRLVAKESTLSEVTEIVGIIHDILGESIPPVPGNDELEKRAFLLHFASQLENGTFS